MTIGDAADAEKVLAFELEELGKTMCKCRHA